MIRNNAPLTKEGKSDAQWTLFKKVKEEKMARRDLSAYLKSKNKSAKTQPWTINKTRGSFTLKFNTKQLTEEQKQLLEKTLSDKLAELGF